VFDRQYFSNIDKTNRITIPAEFLRKLGGVKTNIVIIEGSEACLYLYPFDLDVIKQAFGEIPSCQTVQIKSFGRIQISDELKKHAKLKKTIIMVGCGDYIEVWDIKKWEIELKKAKNLLYHEIARN